MKALILILLLAGISFGFVPTARADQAPGDMDLLLNDTPAETGKSNNDSVHEKTLEVVPKAQTADWYSQLYPWVVQPLRVTLKHEVFYKVETPLRLQDNRSSLRLEYSKFFHNNFFLQLDNKTNVFWGNDHRARAEGKDAAFDNNVREAYLQASFGHTSIKAGIQLLIWGESNIQAITDVVTPRDYREAFLVNLEDSRLGQPMVVLDQFSPVGDWQIFFTPFPKLNKYPRKGDAYFVDAFGGNAVTQEENGYHDFEFGGRWRKTFGKSDINFMGATLLDNDYAYWKNGFTPDGKMLIVKLKERYTMVGMTFNYAVGDLLVKGETALKMPKAFNDANLQIVKKNVLDSSLGVEYAPSGSLTFGLEAGNSHIMGWNDDIMGLPQDTNTLVLTISDKFFNDDLYINWMTTCSWPYRAFVHVLNATYKWNDHLSFELDGYVPDVKDHRSGYAPYRNQKQFAFKIQYQF